MSTIQRHLAEVVTLLWERSPWQQAIEWLLMATLTDEFKLLYFNLQLAWDDDNHASVAEQHRYSWVCWQFIQYIEVMPPAFLLKGASDKFVSAPSLCWYQANKEQTKSTRKYCVY